MEIEQIKQKIQTSKVFRKELSKKSLLWFARIYFSKYLTYPTANFQKRIYRILETKVSEGSVNFYEIISFRGSAKTTISMLFYPIWAMIRGDYHFILLLSDSYEQIKDHIYNIKTELEENRLLIEDFGPFEFPVKTKIKKQEWQATSLIISKYDTKIIGRSIGQKVRGMRYKQWRPQLIIGDDLENLETVRTFQNREKTYRWFTGDIIPLGDRKTKIILIGNLLHNDCLMARIRDEIKNGQRQGIALEIPLIDDEGNIAWRGKYPDEKSIEEEKRRVGANSSPIGMRSWQREYLLKVVPEEGQVIKDEWIRYYDEIPSEGDVITMGTGIDLAISKEEGAHFTAMVSGKVAMVNNEIKVYIMPNPVNERLTGFETTERAKNVSLALGGNILTPLWVEDVSYQKMQIEAMKREGLPVEGVRVSTDKRARLMAVASYVQNGTVLFPKKGCEDLLSQLLGFGVEQYDDLVDAFTLCISGLMNVVANQPKITII